jgi:Ca2+/Na+ antiporter
MNLHFPPTDNLYKFIAISGILLVLYNLIFTSQFLINNHVQAQKISNELDIVEIEQNHLHEDILYLKKKVSILSENLEKKSVEESSEELKEFSTLNAKLKTKNREIEIKIKEMENKNKLLKDRVKFGIFLIIIGLITFIVGIYLTYRGFYLWYHRLQKYQDTLIKKKSKKT